jgi:hypothetical protein
MTDTAGDPHRTIRRDGVFQHHGGFFEHLLAGQVAGPAVPPPCGSWIDPTLPNRAGQAGGRQVYPDEAQSGEASLPVSPQSTQGLSQGLG